MTSGIYDIICVPTAKLYLGSAQDIKYRWRKHIERLRVGKHDNPHLQRAWDKYGEDAFEWRIREVVEIDRLIEREQYWLDLLTPYDHSIGFNISLHADAPMRGRTMTQESRDKMSAVRMGKTPTTETRKKLSASKKGKYYGQFEQPHVAEARARAWVGRKHSDTTRQQMAESARVRQMQPRHIVTHPDGTEELVHLPTFCQAHGLSYGVFTNILCGQKATPYKGYWVRRAD